MSKLSHSRYSIRKVTQEPQSLHVYWNDDYISTFHYIWLLDNSPQSRDVHGQRFHDVSEVQNDAHPLSVKVIDDAGLEILWTSAKSRSYYSAAWLRNHCYSARFQSLPAFNASRTRPSRPELWTGTVDYQADAHHVTRGSRGTSNAKATLAWVVNRFRYLGSARCRDGTERYRKGDHIIGQHSRNALRSHL